MFSEPHRHVHLGRRRELDAGAGGHRRAVRRSTTSSRVSAPTPQPTGRLALVFHSIPDDCANVPACPGIDVFHTQSTDGGRTWSKQQRLTAESIELDSIARTRIGLMLADYVSTSFVRGRPVSVFMLASPRISGRFRQATFAYR